MRTTATNRKVRVLLTAIKKGALVPKPEFQRRLVWSQKHKRAFLQTVLEGYPFPEIYIAAGDVDLATGEGMEMLVDGQQRITTLNQYFTGSADLTLTSEVLPYASLTEAQKNDFLEYEVVVRDLGKMSINEIKQIFQRINSTQYSLNAMEMHNARYDGEFKEFGEKVSEDEFFERHNVFSASDYKRMQDTRYALSVVVTMLSTYFNRDDELESYLERYNDSFPLKDQTLEQIKNVFEFIEECKFPDKCRVWKKVDLFTFLIEIHRCLNKESKVLDAKKVSKKMQAFFTKVDKMDTRKKTDQSVLSYHKAALQATNDRGSRILRGSIVAKLLNA